MTNASFERRLVRIAHSRQDRTPDPSCLIDSEGLVVRDRFERNFARPAWLGLVLLLATALLLKAALVTLVEEQVYEARLVTLEAANPVGKAIAWTMQPGPLTGPLADRLRSLTS